MASLLSKTILNKLSLSKVSQSKTSVGESLNNSSTITFLTPQQIREARKVFHEELSKDRRLINCCLLDNYEDAFWNDSARTGNREIRENLESLIGMDDTVSRAMIGELVTGKYGLKQLNEELKGLKAEKVELLALRKEITRLLEAVSNYEGSLQEMMYYYHDLKEMERYEKYYYPASKKDEDKRR